MSTLDAFEVSTIFMSPIQWGTKVCSLIGPGYDIRLNNNLCRKPKAPKLLGAYGWCMHKSSTKGRGENRWEVVDMEVGAEST